MLRNIEPGMLAEAVRKASGGLSKELSEAYSARLVSETDERLEENVREWLSGEELTDIWIGEYCVGMVMEIQNCGFLTALESLNAYSRDPEAGEQKIWRPAR